ncbi:MAG: R3H domain-containing nucleic acid-binding protein [Candidatus Paceibacterota bacterium]|jgi:spoIIIJ-associated protein|nr:KH domain-containing protein [Candidatus Paceibacterota bacterium]
MIQENLNKIKELIGEFFKKTGLPVEVKVKEIQDTTIPVNIKTDDPQLLIGERGQTLQEMQNLLRMVLRKHLGKEERFFVDLDINDYKKKKAEYLKEIARSAADEVYLSKKDKELPPMSAYERRVIHMALAGRSDVVTESAGEGPDRRVVIKVHP